MEGKKLFLISVLLLSLLSVAFAQEGLRGPGDQKRVNEVGAQNSGYVSKEIQENKKPSLSDEGSSSRINRKDKEDILAARKNVAEAKENLRAKVQEAKDEIKEDVKEVREATKDLVGELRQEAQEREISPERARKALPQATPELAERAKKVREDYLKLKEVQKDQRAKLQDFKEKLSECKSGKVPKEECQGLGKLVVNQGRELLKSSKNKIEGLIEQTKQKVLSSNLPEEKKAELLDNLNKRFDSLVNSTPEVPEGRNFSKEEINSEAKALRAVWEEAKVDIQASAGRMAAEKIGGVLEKTQNLREKLARTLSILKEKGKDTSSLEKTLAEFEARLENARKSHSEAIRLLEEKSPENMKKATDLIRDAHQELKEAHNLLKNLVKDMKESGDDDE